MNDKPQTTTAVEADKVTVSAEFKVQPVSFESVGAFRSYTANLQPGDDPDEVERNLIERAVAITALTVDLQLAVNYGQAPRYRETWEPFAGLCPVRFRGHLGLS